MKILDAVPCRHYDETTKCGAKSYAECIIAHIYDVLQMIGRKINYSIKYCHKEPGK